eukprot:SAG31_NODE_99_length_25388_cov_12.710507_3_plen_173_part_00
MHLIDSQRKVSGEANEWRQRDAAQDRDAIAQWFESHLPSHEPMGSDMLTDAERRMFAMSAQQYIVARRAGELTCAEYAATLVKRAMHYRRLNCFMATSYELMETVVLAQAAALDAKAAKEGIDSIAPLYGLPIPVKGTCATKLFPSCVGVFTQNSNKLSKRKHWQNPSRYDR